MENVNLVATKDGAVSASVTGKIFLGPNNQPMLTLTQGEIPGIKTGQSVPLDTIQALGGKLQTVAAAETPSAEVITPTPAGAGAPVAEAAATPLAAEVPPPAEVIIHATKLPDTYLEEGFFLHDGKLFIKEVQGKITPTPESAYKVMELLYKTPLDQKTLADAIKLDAAQIRGFVDKVTLDVFNKGPIVYSREPYGITVKSIFGNNPEDYFGGK